MSAAYYRIELTVYRQNITIELAIEAANLVHHDVRPLSVPAFVYAS